MSSAAAGESPCDEETRPSQAAFRPTLAAAHGAVISAPNAAHALIN